jgi:hypothetical protein
MGLAALALAMAVLSLVNLLVGLANGDPWAGVGVLLAGALLLALLAARSAAERLVADLGRYHSDVITVAVGDELADVIDAAVVATTAPSNRPGPRRRPARPADRGSTRRRRTS